LADTGIARRDNHDACHVRLEDPRDLPRVARHLKRDPIIRAPALPKQLKVLRLGLHPTR